MIERPNRSREARSETWRDGEGRPVVGGRFRPESNAPAPAGSSAAERLLRLTETLHQDTVVPRSEMVLTERQKNWLLATSGAAPREGRVFKRQTVRAQLKITLEEGDETATALQKMGLITLLPDDEAILTDLGRRLAEELSAPPMTPPAG